MQKNFSEYEGVIGLEVHCQLKTKTKLFCSCSTQFGAHPNTNVCPVCLGLPGCLPVLNKRAVELAVITSIVLNCKINETSIFARKNYFYPDLPKAYQISQYDQPLAVDGSIDVLGEKIGVVRINLEEDAGKLVHKEGYSLVDFNRCGVPLVEIVSKPDIKSPDCAYQYLISLKEVLQYAGISDCNMEEGSLRVDANVSVRRIGEEMGVKVEVKNMNSFKWVERALGYEIERQINILKEGGKITQETRLWDEKKQKTFSMRGKEEAHDYRYFPEPDLLPLVIDKARTEELENEIPELPSHKRKRFVEEYGIPEYDAGVLTSSKELARFFEEVLKDYKNPKAVSNWIMTEVLSIISPEKINECKIKPNLLAKMLVMIEKGEISGKIGKDVIIEIEKTGKDPEEIVKEKGLIQIKDEESLILAVDEVIRENQKAVEEYRSGKEKALGFLIGALMRKTKGRANPELANRIFKTRLA
ncbi:TPA: Asp-tRNA(Asn)/Glu-tRNA(Gln) amidotransferase GatCAB subunit B [bacterium]|nr:Asp-tRNA(Asn)/Glu-tRNA(Gln) amidotransferase GatCAB subunit B [bacterium]